VGREEDGSRKTGKTEEGRGKTEGSPPGPSAARRRPPRAATQGHRDTGTQRHSDTATPPPAPRPIITCIHRPGNGPPGPPKGTRSREECKKTRERLHDRIRAVPHENCQTRARGAHGAQYLAYPGRRGTWHGWRSGIPARMVGRRMTNCPPVSVLSLPLPPCPSRKHGYVHVPS
jgi:hypothetical protein